MDDRALTLDENDVSLLRRQKSQTLGGAGCIVVTAEGESLVPAPRIEVVDTVGAGDAFTAIYAIRSGLRVPCSRA